MSIARDQARSGRARGRRPTPAPMLEDEWIVRGTCDPVSALAAVLGESDDLREQDEWGPDEWNGWCYSMLSRAQSGLWRKAPVGSGTQLASEGCSWQLLSASQRGPGVFAGVYFRT